MHQFDVSIQPIANSRTTKISLLCQFAAILTRIFGQIHNYYRSLLAYTTSTVRDICTFAVLCWVTRPLSRFTRVYEGHFMPCYREEISRVEQIVLWQLLRTFARNFSNIDFFLKILPLKDGELAMSEM